MKQSKFEQIKESFIKDLRNGHYPADTRLPSERTLAQRYNVSYMTFRKLGVDLTNSGILRRSPGDGTYISNSAHAKLNAVKLSFLYDAWEGSLLQKIIEEAEIYAGEHKWDFQVFNLHACSDKYIQKLMDPEMIYLTHGKALMENHQLVTLLQEANSRAVVIGTDMNLLNIPSVLADDTQACNMAIQHLYECGHRKIAMLSTRNANPCMQNRLTAWFNYFHSYLKGKNETDYFIEVPHCRESEIPEASYECTKAFLKKSGDNISAIICMEELQLNAAMHACNDLNIRIPEDISFVSFANTTLSQFSFVPATSIDINLKAHIKVASAIAFDALKNKKLPEKYLHIIEPKLVKRDSVKLLK
jgi:DNA-binding LacI/PurR family transcriptional regulator